MDKTEVPTEVVEMEEAEDNCVTIEDGVNAASGQEIDIVDENLLELFSVEDHEDSSPSDKLGLEKVLIENHSHQNVRKWVRSALRSCRVTLRECHYKIDRDRNHPSSDNSSKEDSGQILVAGSRSKKDRTVKRMAREIESVTASKPDEEVEGPIKLSNVDGRSNMFCEWMDGNIFSCRKCVFTNKSLVDFSNHIETHHKTTLAKFSGGYTKTAVKYQCKICRKKVYHEKSVVKEHVECHLLDLTDYTVLYEKENVKKISAQSVSQLFDPKSIQSPENSEVEFLTSIELLSIPPINAPSLLPTAVPSSFLPAASSNSSETSNSVDKFVYVCPFTGCSFHTDLQGMKSGPAAEHGIEQHQVSPWEVKQQGLKWKRVSREKMMRKERSGIKM